MVYQFKNIINNNSKRRLVDIWTHLYTALILIVALAWNEAIKSIFELNPRLKNYGPWIYAIFVTIIIFFVIDIVDFIGKVEDIHN
tara:strand:- start:257 stop:511 length:255 start_codon:yes stop_codon:yes gene_type:complete